MLRLLSTFLAVITAFTSTSALSAERVPPGTYLFGQAAVLNLTYSRTKLRMGFGDDKPMAPSMLFADERGNLTISLGNISQTRVRPLEEFNVSIGVTAKMLFTKASTGDLEFLAPAYMVSRERRGTTQKQFIPAQGSFSNFSAEVSPSKIVLSFMLTARIEGRLPCKFDVEATYFR